MIHGINDKKHVYIIAGSNGAGKTTFAREFLPRYVHCTRFINPDLIAAGLSPFDPSAAAIEAGRLVLREIRHAIQAGETFAFESTLSGRGYLTIIRRAKAVGYRIHIFYLWIPSVELGLARIRDRVENGGHDVPAVDVRRRYARTLRNLLLLYRGKVHSLHLFYNAGTIPELVFREEDGQTVILNRVIYSKLTKQVHHEKT